MTTNSLSRRTAVKLLLAGSVASVGVACNAIKSLPRGQSRSTTDGSELALRVRDALSKNAFTSLLNVDIKSSGDTVVIKGFVDNQSDIDNLDQVANQVEGVRHAQIDAFVRKD